MTGTAAPAADAEAALDAYLDAAAAMAGIALPPGSRLVVLENLRLLFAHARLFVDVPLAPSLEPAPVFRP